MNDLDKQLQELRGQRKKGRRQRSKMGWVDLLLFFVVLCIVFLGFVVVMMVSYPDAAQEVAKDVFTPKGVANRVVSGVVNRASESYSFRVKPLFSRVVNLFSPAQKKGRPQAQAQLALESKSCIKCHPDLFEREVFARLNVRHRLHEAAGTACGECHLSDKHPEMETVSEKACVKCHRANQVSSECDDCHVPGSIIAKQDLAEGKFAEFLSGGQSRSNVLVPAGFEHPVDYENQVCKQCHEVPAFCIGCHVGIRGGILRGPHDDNWVPTHGPRIFRRELTVSGCLDCHNNLFCAGSCHPNEGRERMNPGWPLPELELPS